MRWLVLGMIGLAGCGLMEPRLGEPVQLVGQETVSLFAGLKIVTIRSLPVMCPCFELVAKSPGQEVVLNYEVGSQASPTSIEVNGKELDRPQWHALGKALLEAAKQPDARQQEVREVAEYLILHGERYL